MHGTLTNLLQSYGYIVLFVFVGLESLGIPLPGETTLVTAAAFAASGYLSIYRVVIVAAAAAILGDNGGYWIGREGGLRLVKRYGRVLHIDEGKMEHARQFFDRHGAKTVIGRFIALLRTWAAVLAGVGDMQYGTFMFYNALGGITWAQLFGMLGYLFGRNLPSLNNTSDRPAFALLAALIAALFLGTSWFRSNSSRIAAHISRAASLIGSSDTLRRFQKRHPGAWEFIIHRFEAGEYLGLHLTIGLVVSVAALCLFGGVTEDVIHHDPLTQFDVTLLEWFQAYTTNSGMQIFAAISSLGSPLVMTALGLTVALALAVRRSWLVLFGWAGALGGAGVMDALLKHNLRRPRPIYASAFLHSFSFPSGHAMGSLVGYGMLAYLLLSSWTHRWQVRVAIVSIAALLTLAIGVSRLYLGVHYFSDVVGGYAASVLRLSASITGLEIARRQPHSQGPEEKR